MKSFSRLQLVFAVAGAVVLSAGAAQAFTFSDQNGNTGNAKGYLDLDSKSSRSDQSGSQNGADDKNKMQWGGSTLQFGAGTFGGSRGFDQRYNNENLFNPYARDGRQ